MKKLLAIAVMQLAVATVLHAQGATKKVPPPPPPPPPKVEVVRFEKAPPPPPKPANSKLKAPPPPPTIEQVKFAKPAPPPPPVPPATKKRASKKQVKFVPPVIKKDSVQ